jgi:ATP-dependent helicase/nuclease subunit B
MDIVFGLCADGGAVPDHGGAGVGALGAPVVGPAGLVDILETAYGLSGPTSPRIIRIAAWQAAL